MKLIGLISILLLFNINTFATHVIGGNMDVCQTGPNTFEITMRIYRDCGPNNASLSAPTGVEIRDNVTNGLNQTISMSGSQVGSATVITLGDSCYQPTGICVEEYVYTKTVTLANNPNGYYISWDICCRNGLITNANVGSSTSPSEGIAFYAQIPDPALVGGNCLPTFGGYPTDGYFCLSTSINNPFIIDPQVTDADGDSLVFSLVNPYNDGSTIKPFNILGWQAGHSATNLLGNTTLPNMVIDSETGVITCYPENIGVYVFAIMVKEYRFGIQIGETVRDVQYSSLNCTIDSPPIISLSDTVSVYYGDSICVDMTISDSDGTDTIYVSPTSIDFDLIGNYVAPTQVGTDYIYTDFNNTGVDGTMSHFADLGTAYQGVGDILLRYCWEPECEDVDSTYNVNLLAYSLGCSGSDTTEREIVFSIEHDPIPQATLDAASDTLQVTYGDQICFDLMVDVSFLTDTLEVRLNSPNFDLSGNYVDPVVLNNQSYYQNFFGVDTVFVSEIISNPNTQEYQGIGQIPFRFCMTPGCDEIDETFIINMEANTIGCGGSDTLMNTYYVEVDYDPTPIDLNIPNVIEVSYGSEICFDLLTNDITSSGYVLGLKPVGAEINYSEAYVAPNQNANGFYYSNFQGLDTLYIENYNYVNGQVRGTDTVALRYCLIPGCEEVILENYELEFKATLYTPCFELNQTKSMQVVVEPPVGELSPIPNVFTPNGDGFNDYFELSGSNDPCFDVMEIEIFNRWGKKVFVSDDANFQWNGDNKNDGGKCAEGTYYVLMKGSYGSTYNTNTGERIPNPVDRQYTIQLLR